MCRQLLLRIFLLLVLLAGTLTACAGSPPAPSAGTQTPVSSGALPIMPQKPAPQEITFQGCPPEGDGGDPALNRLKNRVDEGNYVPVAFDAVAKLAWPKGTERRSRTRWSQTDSESVARYEGIPISIEGYLESARLSEPESTNCHGADSKHRDYHLYLIANPGDSRATSIITEMTPRVRVKHSGWTVTRLGKIAKSQTRARISGWLMLDQEHPDDVGKSRGTIWEIHPIMRFELEQDGNWVALDDAAVK
jgi:hypothetical protein